MDTTVVARMRLTTRHQSSSEYPLRPRLAPAWALAAVVLTTAIVFAIDSLTGVPHVQHLYYFPIILAAITFGMTSGAGVAALAIALYHVANPHTVTWRYEESDVLQMGVFLAVGLVAAKLADDARRLHQLAMTDDLTGLHNLRSFEVELRRMVESSRRAGTPLSLLVIDVDRLKSLNDEHGHLVGAEAVRTVGGIIAQHIPTGAAACRYGGDEFVVALPQCGGSTGLRVADDVRRAVRASHPTLAGVQFAEGTLSISIGVASRRSHRTTEKQSVSSVDDESEALFRAADTALYAAKNGGRDRVHRAPK